MTYHHGNARIALLDAARDLLEQGGAAGLSLRKVAERAGLSRQAPYNHFDNKKALLGELAADGFRRLTEQMQGDAGSNPLARLAAAANSYIAFGVEQPALFRLMFGRELVDVNGHDAAREAAVAARDELSAIIAALGPAEAVADVTLVAWSLVHGYTDLCVEAQLEAPELRWQRADLFARTVEALLTKGC